MRLCHGGDKPDSYHKALGQPGPAGSCQPLQRAPSRAGQLFPLSVHQRGDREIAVGWKRGEQGERVKGVH